MSRCKISDLTPKAFILINCLFFAFINANQAAASDIESAIVVEKAEIVTGRSGSDFYLLELTLNKILDRKSRVECSISLITKDGFDFKGSEILTPSHHESEINWLINPSLWGPPHSKDIGSEKYAQWEKKRKSFRPKNIKVLEVEITEQISGFFSSEEKVYRFIFENL
ncbi:hypothetical protein [Shewanella sp. SM74]|uniref:hypothetical protein n=1 Tax=Shewanella sp. SM74 TaxID=2912807 RepID=UPI0021D98E1F|nr:hypothetical protein [Shewanella sp. SM74]MCU8013673.1 hypothetical protein [Shewanella sp. SM74]